MKKRNRNNNEQNNNEKHKNKKGKIFNNYIQNNNIEEKIFKDFKLVTYKEIDEKSYMMSEYKNKIAINTHGAQLDA